MKTILSSGLFPVALGAALAMGAGTQVSHAQTPSPELAKIETLVTNMGYTPNVGSSGTWFSIAYSSSYSINFSLSGDKTTLYLYVQYGINAAQQPLIPFLPLLQWNDTHRDYFSINNDKTLVVLNMNLPADGLTPQILRVALSDLGDDSDQGQKIFDPTNWK
jgi:hypothetical protein